MDHCSLFDKLFLASSFWRQFGQNLGSEQRTRQALEALKQVGLSQRMRHRGLELSGGEQQRVALARALVHNPRFIVADEPTGNLDTVTGREISNLLRDIAHKAQVGLLVATHDATVVAYSDRMLRINDGCIVDE